VCVHRELVCALMMEPSHDAGQQVVAEEEELPKDIDDRAAKEALADARQNDALTFSSLLSEKALEAQADHCNNRKLAARKVQDARGLLLLCLLVKDKPVVCDAVVMGVGDRFINVFMYQYGTNEKIYMNDTTNLNGWIFAPKTEEDSNDGVLTLQWTEEYDPNDNEPFSVKRLTMQAATEDVAASELNDDNDDAKDREIARRAAAKADMDEANARLQDSHLAGANRKGKRHAAVKASGGDKDDGERHSGHCPSQLPSREQKLRVLDVIRVRLGMRPDTLRASLQARMLHPADPRINETLETKEEIEYENLDAT